MQSKRSTSELYPCSSVSPFIWTWNVTKLSAGFELFLYPGLVMSLQYFSEATRITGLVVWAQLKLFFQKMVLGQLIIYA